MAAPAGVWMRRLHPCQPPHRHGPDLLSAAACPRTGRCPVHPDAPDAAACPIAGPAPGANPAPLSVVEQHRLRFGGCARANRIRLRHKGGGATFTGTVAPAIATRSWFRLLQLRFVSPPMRLGGPLLMASSPRRPGEYGRSSHRRSQQRPRKQQADFRHAGQAAARAVQAASAGLVLFGLPQAVRRSVARNPARKTPAAMRSVMCRCQPCQDRASHWSRPRSSLAR